MSRYQLISFCMQPSHISGALKKCSAKTNVRVHTADELSNSRLRQRNVETEKMDSVDFSTKYQRKALEELVKVYLFS